MVEEQTQTDKEKALATNRFMLKVSAGTSLIFASIFLLVFVYFLNRITRSLANVTERMAGSSHQVARTSTALAESSTELAASVNACS